MYRDWIKKLNVFSTFLWPKLTTVAVYSEKRNVEPTKFQSKLGLSLSISNYHNSVGRLLTQTNSQAKSAEKFISARTEQAHLTDYQSALGAKEIEEA